MAVKNLLTKSFLERTISGIGLVTIALVTIISGGDILFATTLTISLIGLSELYKVFMINRNIVGLIGYLAIIGYYVLLRTQLSEYIIIGLVLVLMIFMCIYVFTFPKYKTEQISMGIFGIIYVAVMLSYIYQVRIGSNGVYAVWLIFLCSWGSDTFAYLTGVTMGKHKMAPVLSPKKSIEGACGGVIGAALLGFAYAAIFQNKIDMVLDVRIAFPIICAVGSFISMIGDLAASAIKRNHNIKDYGKLIPGHGGILDRFDSVIFTAPIIWFLLTLMN